MKTKKVGAVSLTKSQLLRDGQIVGYERINGESVDRSYDNQAWVPGLLIPFDTKRAFLTFDATTLTEVYEDAVQ